MTEARFEYGEMNISKLNQRIDDIEDEIFREKMKVKKCSDELNDTFDDMISNYWFENCAEREHDWKFVKKTHHVVKENKLYLMM